MSEEINVRVCVRDLSEREYTCDVSSAAGSRVATQVELARLMGEVFRVLSHHLVAPPNDDLLLEKFAEAALDWDIKVRDSDDLSDEIKKQFED
jgi:hypothetical protein